MGNKGAKQQGCYPAQQQQQQQSCYQFTVILN